MPQLEQNNTSAQVLPFFAQFMEPPAIVGSTRGLVYNAEVDGLTYECVADEIEAPGGKSISGSAGGTTQDVDADYDWSF